MSKRYRILNERNFRYFCHGLTLDAKDMDVLDAALVALDAQTKIPSNILAHNQRHGYGPPIQLAGGQVIVTLEKHGGADDKTLSLTHCVRHKDLENRAPALHIMLRSWTLDIPQRVEIPLRYVLKGLPDIRGTYMLYMHVLTMAAGEEFVYYGLTKRGWMKRFNEHMQHAMRDESPLLFHRTLRAGVVGRMHQLHSPIDHQPSESIALHVMAANHHVVCAAGLSEDKALEGEEYLVAKYSFNKPVGLNMIPGGRAGIAYLHRLAGSSSSRSLTAAEDRERALGEYLKAHPKGLPNPTIAERWKDDEFAERIICSGERRLTRTQIAEIREATGRGKSVEEITEIVGARNMGQVARVVRGKTCGRIR